MTGPLIDPEGRCERCGRLVPLECPEPDGIGCGSYVLEVTAEEGVDTAALLRVGMAERRAAELAAHTMTPEEARASPLVDPWRRQWDVNPEYHYPERDIPPFVGDGAEPMREGLERMMTGHIVPGSVRVHVPEAAREDRYYEGVEWSARLVHEPEPPPGARSILWQDPATGPGQAGVIIARRITGEGEIRGPALVVTHPPPDLDVVVEVTLLTAEQARRPVLSDPCALAANDMDVPPDEPCGDCDGTGWASESNPGTGGGTGRDEQIAVSCPRGCQEPPCDNPVHGHCGEQVVDATKNYRGDDPPEPWDWYCPRCDLYLGDQDDLHDPAQTPISPAHASAGPDGRLTTVYPSGESYTDPTPRLEPIRDPACRVCFDCRGSHHHWMEDMIDGAEWEYSPDPMPVWGCKHCEFTMPYCMDGLDGDEPNEMFAYLMLAKHDPTPRLEPAADIDEGEFFSAMDDIVERVTGTRPEPPTAEAFARGTPVAVASEPGLVGKVTDPPPHLFGGLGDLAKVWIEWPDGGVSGHEPHEVSVVGARGCEADDQGPEDGAF